ncbi:MAG: aminotransferase class IV [Bacillota bacterium]
MIVYLNGDFLPSEKALIPVEERASNFGDGIYEVVSFASGRFFAFAEHMDRLRYSAREIRLQLPEGAANYPKLAERLVAENNLGDYGTVYMQISRGAAPRGHAFPANGTRPTVYLAVKPGKYVPDEERADGRPAITHPDLRWGRCDIKSLNLLPNVLAKQAAAEAGAQDCILIRDGIAIEGASSNFFAVLGGTLVTHPRGPHILGGITRNHVLRLAESMGIPVREEPIPVEAIWKADELFFSGTTTEVMPITQIDGKVAGGGRRGPIAAKLQAALHKEMWGK